MKSISLTLLFISVFSFSIQAQQYDYSKFKFPNLHIRQLTGSIDLTSNGSNLSYTTFLPNERTESAFRGIALFNYAEIKNSENIQKYDNYNFHFQHNYTSKRTISPTASNVKNNIVNTSIRNNSVYRKYINSSDLSLFGISQPYYEIDKDISLGYQYDLFNISSTMPLKVGIGRIEPISQIFNAQFLMDDLKKEGLITSNFSEEKLYELAQLMEQVNRKRVFDSRRARIYQLETLSKWMEDNNVAPTAKSFTILNDNWTFNQLNNRNFGKRLSFGFVPFYVENINSSISSTPAYYGFSSMFEFLKAKAVNQSFQSNVFLSLSYNYLKKFSNPVVNFLALKGVHEMSFNPNSRSTYSLKIAPEVLVNKDGRSLGFGTSFSFQHFLNYRTYLSGAVTLKYQNQNTGIWRVNQENLLSYEESPFFAFTDTYNDFIFGYSKINSLLFNANLKLNVILF